MTDENFQGSVDELKEIVSGYEIKPGEESEFGKFRDEYIEKNGKQQWRELLIAVAGV